MSRSRRTSLNTFTAFHRESIYLEIEILEDKLARLDQIDRQLENDSEGTVSCDGEYYASPPPRYEVPIVRPIPRRPRPEETESMSDPEGERACAAVISAIRRYSKRPRTSNPRYIYRETAAGLEYNGIVEVPAKPKSPAPRKRVRRRRARVQQTPYHAKAQTISPKTQSVWCTCGNETDHGALRNLLQSSKSNQDRRSVSL